MKHLCTLPTENMYVVNPLLVSPHSQFPSLSELHSTGSEVDGGGLVDSIVEKRFIGFLELTKLKLIRH